MRLFPVRSSSQARPVTRPCQLGQWRSWTPWTIRRRPAYLKSFLNVTATRLILQSRNSSLITSWRQSDRKALSTIKSTKIKRTRRLDQRLHAGIDRVRCHCLLRDFLTLATPAIWTLSCSVFWTFRFSRTTCSRIMNFLKTRSVLKTRKDCWAHRQLKKRKSCACISKLKKFSVEIESVK